ncbi:MAG: YncE family protein [Bryobacteraceae bacterium]
MKKHVKKRTGRIISSLAFGVILAATYFGRESNAQSPANRFPAEISSQNLALTADGLLLAVVNPDNDSVSFFDVRNDRNVKLAELLVGIEPNAVTFNPAGTRAYVANTVSGTVSVIAVNRGSFQVARVLMHVAVGTEPYALAMTPNGTKLYVANARSNTLSVMDPNTNRVYKTVDNVGAEPRGLAISNDGDDDDSDESVYVTQFLALPVAVGRLDGEDDSKVGLVTVLSANDDAITRTIVLRPLADSGFKAAGDAIARTAPPATITEESLRFNTGAYPNQLNSIAVRGNFAFVPSTGASPNGPLRFDVNTQSLLSVIDRGRNLDAGRTINMHLAVKNQAGTPRLFITQPWSIAFKTQGGEAFVVSAASNTVVKVNADPTTGQPLVLPDPADRSKVLHIRTGKNPRGIVVNAGDTRAYVMNYISRDVTVIDLTSAPEKVLATMRSAALPAAGTLEDTVLIGKDLYNTSIGEFDPATPGGSPITGRMSNNGWGSCGACHPNGLSDNVVWIFGAGPRRTISQHVDFDITDPNNQKAFNWSGIFDEEEDFEGNIRGTSGGAGLIVQADGVTADPALAAFGTANKGRRQLRVRGVGAWDAIRTYIQIGIRPPISPLSKQDPDVIAGEEIFRQNNCQQCHGGTQWTSSRIVSPVAAGDLSNGQIIGQLKKVGTFDASIKTEIRQNAAAPLGPDGFVPPSLLSLFAFPRTFFHNGSADSLEAVMNNVEHRVQGTGGVDLLEDPEQRRKLIRFLLSIDAASTPIYP